MHPASRGAGGRDALILLPISMRIQTALGGFCGLRPLSLHPPLCIPTVTFSSRELGRFCLAEPGEDEPGGYWEHPQLRLGFPITVKDKNEINSGIGPPS